MGAAVGGMGVAAGGTNPALAGTGEAGPGSAQPVITVMTDNTINTERLFIKVSQLRRDSGWAAPSFAERRWPGQERISH
jgi:hypothetical protein